MSSIDLMSSSGMDPLNGFESIEPWLKTKKPPEGGKEYKQSPADRKKLDGLYECMLCACCTTSCPSYWWNPEEVIGPAALLRSYRRFSDSRDDFREERLQAMTEEENRLNRYRTIRNCTATCPKNLNPASAINRMKAMYLFSPAVEDKDVIEAGLKLVRKIWKWYRC